MSNKERLEKIEERVLVDKVYYKYLDGTGGHWSNIYTLSEEDYNYLKEQAELVQELEKELEEWQNEALRLFKLLEEYQEIHLKAERIEELEKELDEWTNEALRLFKLLEEYKESNKRYREALEFYADENSYRKIGFAELYSPAEKDFGQKARQALEGE